MEKIKEKISILIFVIALWMLMMRQIMAMMPIIPNFVFIVEVYGNKILWCSIMMLGVAIVCNRPSIWDIIACVWSVVTFYISNDAAMLILMFLIVSARRIKVDKVYIVKAWMIPTSILMIATITLYPILHMQGNPIAIDHYGICWNYFFGHPNSFSLWFAFWVLGIAYLVAEKMPRWLVCLGMIMASIFLLIVPKGRTATVVLILGSILLLLEKYAWKVCKMIICMSPVVSIMVTVILTMLYYYGVLLCDQYVLHPTLSMRFQDAAINLIECPLNLWGQQVNHLGDSILIHGILRYDVSMDNGIVALLIYYGVLLGTILLVTFVMSIFAQAKAEDERHRIQAVFLMLTFVMGMMEWPAWYGTIGFPMFFMGDWIRENDKKKSKSA